MRSERGFTLVELLVAMAIGIVVALAIFGLIDVSTRTSARVAARVDANQRARPVMQRLVDELHSTCIGPNTMPVLAGSGDDSVSFLSQTGSAVSPTPDEHVVTLSGSALTESVYAATGGSAPNWTFSGTATSTRQLLTGVSRASIGGQVVPVFRYFAYQGGQLSSTPLPTTPNGLSQTDAARTVEVTVSFAASPSSNPARDPGASVSVSDSAILRLSPAAEDANQLNPPCA